MTVFEIVALCGALAGLSMILGGIWLIAKGAITLAATAPSEALSIEWKRQLRLSTQVPGIAFFVLGLAFFALPLWALSPNDVEPITIDGQIEGVDEPVSISVQAIPQSLQTSSDGRVMGKVYPDMSVLMLHVSAPGHAPYVMTIKAGRTTSIGKLRLRRTIQASQITARVNEKPPFDVPPLASDRDYNFGVAR